jgi:hypothetical protein
MRNLAVAALFISGLVLAEEQAAVEQRDGDLGRWEVQHLTQTPDLVAPYYAPVELKRLYEMLYDPTVSEAQFVEYFWPHQSSANLKTIRELRERWSNAPFKPLIMRQAKLVKASEFYQGWYAFLVVSYRPFDARTPAAADVLFARTDGSDTRFMVDPYDKSLLSSFLNEGKDYIDRRHLRDPKHRLSLELEREERRVSQAKQQYIKEMYEGMIDRLLHNNGDPREVFALREEYNLAMAGRKLDSLGKIVEYYNADYLSPPNFFDCHAALHFNKRTPIECLELHLYSLHQGDRRYYTHTADPSMMERLREFDRQGVHLKDAYPFPRQLSRINVLMKGEWQTTYQNEPRHYLVLLYRAQDASNPRDNEVYFSLAYLRKIRDEYFMTAEPEFCGVSNIFRVAGMEQVSGPYPTIEEAGKKSVLPSHFHTIKWQSFPSQR